MAYINECESIHDSANIKHDAHEKQKEVEYNFSKVKNDKILQRINNIKPSKSPKFYLPTTIILQNITIKIK